MIRSYHEGVIEALRSAWNSPSAAPPPPRRVWRDWVAVVVVVLGATLEGVLRTDLLRPLLSVIVLVAVAPTLLWRRTRPLLMLAIAFITMSLVAVVIGSPVQLYTSVLLLLLPYSLVRWGNGRAIAVGLAVILANLAFSVLSNPVIADIIGAVAVVFITITLGAALRYRARARMRELDRVKLLEREMLARDLHDTVAHHVSAIAIRAQAGLATAMQRPDAATDALTVIEAEASKTLAEMRSMVRVLRRDDSPDLAPNPRLTDIEQLASVEQGGPTVDVRVTGDIESIPPAVAAAVYRLAQESVTNARRHARRATRINVVVEVDDDAVRLSVTNDGEIAQVSTPGYGITGMIERASLLGGTCESARAPGGGWVVTAVLPRIGWTR